MLYVYNVNRHLDTFLFGSNVSKHQRTNVIAESARNSVIISRTGL